MPPGPVHVGCHPCGSDRGRWRRLSFRAGRNCGRTEHAWALCSPLREALSPRTEVPAGQMPGDRPAVGIAVRTGDGGGGLHQDINTGRDQTTRRNPLRQPPRRTDRHGVRAWPAAVGERPVGVLSRSRSGCLLLPARDKPSPREVRVAGEVRWAEKSFAPARHRVSGWAPRPGPRAWDAERDAREHRSMDAADVISGIVSAPGGVGADSADVSSPKPADAPRPLPRVRPGLVRVKFDHRVVAPGCYRPHRRSTAAEAFRRPHRLLQRGPTPTPRAKPARSSSCWTNWSSKASGPCHPTRSTRTRVWCRRLS